jgi:NAD(P)-dependent dehydrogenase (short-subunit alcohol dehydrogenase family)
LAQRGAALTLGDIDFPALNTLAETIERAGGRAQAISCDVTKEAEAAAIVAAAVDRFGFLSGAANVSGVSGAQLPIHQIDLETWNRTLAINLTGQFLCMKHQVAAMLPGGGSIVFVASIAAEMGIAGGSDYCASKAGLSGLVRAAVADYAKQGIRANAIMPGTTRTRLFELAMANAPGLEDHLVAATPVGRLAEPQEMADAIAWLLSDQSSYVTGAVIPIDGGALAL